MVFNDPVPERRNLLILTLLIHAWYILDIQPSAVMGATKASIFWGTATIRYPELIVYFIWTIYGWHFWQWMCLDKCFWVIKGNNKALSFTEELYYYRLEVINDRSLRSPLVIDDTTYATSSLQVHILHSIRQTVTAVKRVTARMENGLITPQTPEMYAEKSLDVELADTEETQIFWRRLKNEDDIVSMSFLDVTRVGLGFEEIQKYSRGLSGYSELSAYIIFIKKLLNRNDKSQINITGTLYLESKEGSDNSTSFEILITGKWPKSIIRSCFYHTLLQGKYISRIFIPTLIASTALVWAVPFL